jgi:hypothetical protein
MSQFFIDFINQLDIKRPVQKQLHEIMRAQLGIKTGAKEKAATAEKSPRWEHLNEVGRKAAKREELSTFVQSNAQAKLSLKKLRAGIKESLPKLPGREPSDLAGVLQDQEIRTYVRSLPQEQRDRLQRMHPDIAAAVARMPAELSGVSPSVHQELINETLRKTHGAELAKVGADVAALELADELIRTADKEIRAAAEVAHTTDFRAWAKPLVDPILTEAGADFDELYRRQDPQELNILGALVAA